MRNLLESLKCLVGLNPFIDSSGYLKDEETLLFLALGMIKVVPHLIF